MMFAPLLFAYSCNRFSHELVSFKNVTFESRSQIVCHRFIYITISSHNFAFVSTYLKSNTKDIKQ